jgi:F5/8 type C domain-containing protein
MNSAKWGRLKRLGVEATSRALPWAPARVAAVRWLVLLTGACALGWTLWSPSRNLARGKPISMSSSCEQRPEYSALPAGAERLIDGKKDRAYDACTRRESRPWVRLDLQAPTRLTRVVVTGRRDCCWGSDSLPLVLELSDDDQSFREVARRDIPTSDRDPWRIDLRGAEARYLRLRVKASRAELVLSEIEVFGSVL